MTDDKSDNGLKVTALNSPVVSYDQIIIGQVVNPEQMLHCPDCNNNVSGYGHLRVGEHFGPWYCDHCGAGWDGVKTNLTVNIKRSDKIKVNTLVVLAFVNDPAFKIIVKGMVIMPKDGDILDHINDGYYYNEHTCPWNYLRLPVKLDDDTDPHGLFQWVKTVRAPADLPDDNEELWWDIVDQPELLIAYKEPEDEPTNT